MSRLPRWWPLAGALAGGWVVTDAVHLPLTAVLPLGAVAAGWWLLSGRRPTPRLPMPRTSAAWIERCERLLEQFSRLEAGDHPGLDDHRCELMGLRQRQQRSALEVALVGLEVPNAALMAALASALKGSMPIRLHSTAPLARASAHWLWPAACLQCDQLLYRLSLPLQAADLRWLESLPAGQPLGLLVELGANDIAGSLHQELLAQLPEGLGRHLLIWDGEAPSLEAALQPLRRRLGEPGRCQLEATQLRCLRQFHARLQADLETVRRRRWKQLQQRTQWVVAAGVFAAPLPSVDLLVLGIANGLMLKEMAELWDCPWTGDQLRETALELGKAALALGLVEWSTQALAGLIKLHGATWLVGGAIQALSAAYLTRVVSHAMADVLALSVGVEATDLEQVRRQAPLLVARAAETEKLDWVAFLQQGRTWWQQQGAGAAGTMAPGRA
ncbi:YcjF family protein [Cyanobium sp. Morenito 9A2]|uniref:YcjF family protein n=1 Tax=Cyanobium sp. Morenito 9A2 TaxID=2823718 RepID=UPI0020CE3AC8|nr:YcjF family protein [Cyanobium sp. Morenito 9A2]MCP9849402.1 YcjF family protein [Cyanobium sp. Morenito 9A2]